MHLINFNEQLLWKRSKKMLLPFRELQEQIVLCKGSFSIFFVKRTIGYRFGAKEEDEVF